MHSMKLTVLIDDTDDLDMEVRVVASHAEHVGANVTPIKPHVVVAAPERLDDEYTLGGYAGI
ncbi:hypothetical protein IM816_17795 [Luteibacter flocculans]|uniref:Universal stress protein n=1 Tax=Luteibacter flocculans TaxID=2780091 RepID=A0ABY4T0C6_9GAMM|nr:hypothetical protein [Luteibacter flocculans]URL58413.1 hypothetical protein IM816_17795 [Luteibacter flocculans]